jgi:catechol 2,3-dioxygenase-like lactoylglutathione lyase family enzyme
MPDIVTGVDFVSIATRDLPRAIAFYRDVLGLRLSLDRSPYNVEFDTGTVTLSIIDPVVMGIGEFSANPQPLALQVRDFAAARAAIAAHDVTFTREDHDSGVCNMAFLADPDDNALMLHHRYAPKEN